MKNTDNLIYFENTFFAIKCALKTNDSSYWEIIRKINTLPGANGELLEIVAQCLQLTSNTYFLFDLKDFEMCKDLVSIGASRVGYLTENSNGKLVIDGWGEEWVGDFTSINEIGNPSKFRKNLFILREIRHSLNSDYDFFIESFFKRDRIFWGITQKHPNWKAKKNNPLMKNQSGKTIENWANIIQTRKSVTSFSQDQITQEELEDFLSQSLYKRADGRLLYGTSGGFDEINPYLAIRGIKGLDPGLYKVSTKTNKLVFIKRLEIFDMLENFLILPDELLGASVFLFFAVSFNDIYEKYGQRAIRFSLLNLGGALQQIHLASTALGLQYRTIGGFDELQCSKILNLDKSEYLACAGILGK